MKIFLSSFFITIFSVFSATAVAAESNDGPKNCKITVRTKFKSGKKKLDIEEVHAATREECKLMAKDRERTSDEEVEKITASYGFR